jgi:formamidopyrimidine-DNA glycosylase
MPELPEVETIVCGLRNRLIGLEFSKVEVGLEKSIQGSKKSFIASLRGRKILRAERQGKNIILHLNGGVALRVHLRMTGRLRFVPAQAPPEKHTHVVFSFQGQPCQLRFVDPRQFGRLCVEKKGIGDTLSSLADLGPEPFDIAAKEFIRRTQLKHRAIKPLLLDQRFLAGVGNIYADEALHRARIHPRWRADTLGEEALLRLYHALRRILQEAIRAGGTSVRTYVDTSGSTGAFQHSLRVYGREGRACGFCGSPIVRERVGGRGTFFCPRCQPLRPKRSGPIKVRSTAGKFVA